MKLLLLFVIILKEQVLLVENIPLSFVGSQISRPSVVESRNIYSVHNNLQELISE